MKLLLISFALGFVLALVGAKALGEGEPDIDPRPHHHRSQQSVGSAEAIDLLRRLTRQAAVGSNKETPGSNKAACKYRKGTWSACDPQTKVRTRTFTLKKGDANVCEATKTLLKECKGGKKAGKQRNNAKNRSNKNANNNNNRPRP